jgi:hypothetical protein
MNWPKSTVPDEVDELVISLFLFTEHYASISITVSGNGPDSEDKVTFALRLSSCGHAHRSLSASPRQRHAEVSIGPGLFPRAVWVILSRLPGPGG